MSFFHDSALVGASGQSAGGAGYSISRSLRFNSADSAYLSRTPASAGNRKTWTWAGWVKRSVTAANETLFYANSGGLSDSTYFRIVTGPTGIIQVSGYATAWRITSALYRDPSAWMHIVVTVDTTSATEANRIRIYVNGLEVTLFSFSTGVTQNADLGVNQTAIHEIGRSESSNFFNGYLADVHFIDGQALTPTSFGQFSATTGVWVPKAYSGPTATGNSFWLSFSDNSTAAATTLGKDNFNLGNNWTPNNVFVSAGASVSGISASSIGNVDLINIGGAPQTLNVTSLNNLLRNSTFLGSTYVGGNEFRLSGTSGSTVTISYSGMTGITGIGIRYGRWSGTDSNFSISGTVSGSFIGTSTNTRVVLSTTSTSGTITFATSNASNGLYISNISFEGVNFNGPTQIDSLVDVPTNGVQTDTGVGGEVRGNYCTFNPLSKTFTGTITFSNGNLDVAESSGAYATIPGTIAISSGKFYWEITRTSTSAANTDCGVGLVLASASSLTSIYADSTYIYRGDGTKRIAGGPFTVYGASWTTGDVIGVAADLNASTLTFYKNGVSQGAATTSLPVGVAFFPCCGDDTSGTQMSWTANFGQRPFAYPVAGFKALCTANLPAPVVTKPSDLFDVKLYTGNGSTQTVSGLGFSPDLVWIKARNTTNAYQIFDTVRGASIGLSSNTTDADSNNAPYGLTSFGASSFNVNDISNGGYGVNGSSLSQVYAAWCWDAGNTTVTNTQGSISSQVRANASAGFSVVTYTGSSSGSTVGHGLGVAPAFIIGKSRNNSSEWSCYHQSLGNGQAIILNTTAAATGTSTWNSTSPTSSVISLGAAYSVNYPGYTHVLYCFAPVVGYSNAFSYSGNGSSDGPFCFLGFRPRLILLKVTNTTGPWYLFDTARNTYNVMNNRLEANSSSAEASDRSVIDALSNGFKLRDVDAVWNQSGNTYVGFAFAESPFAANNRAR